LRKIFESLRRNVHRAIGRGEGAMDRCRDYLGFAVRFFGLGYLVLWPLSTPDRGELFGAGLVCKDGGLFDVVCRLPHPLHLGVGVHATGALCALLAVLNLLVYAVRRVRRHHRAAAPAGAPLPVAPRSAPQRVRRRPLPPPCKIVRPRTHFGLRGLPDRRHPVA
jgi:hypothetical protein